MGIFGKVLTFAVKRILPWVAALDALKAGFAIGTWLGKFEKVNKYVDKLLSILDWGPLQGFRDWLFKVSWSVERLYKSFTDFFRDMSTWEIIKTVSSMLWKGIKSIPNMLYNLFDSIGSYVVSSFINIGPSIVQAFISITDRIWSLVKDNIFDSISKSYEFISSIPDKLSGIFDSIGSSIVQAFVSITDRIWSFIKENIFGGIGKVASSAWDFIKGNTDNKIGETKSSNTDIISDSLKQALFPTTKGITHLVDILTRKILSDDPALQIGNLVEPIPFKYGGFIKKDLIGKLHEGETVIPKGISIIKEVLKTPEVMVRPEVVIARQQSEAQQKTERIIREVINISKSAVNNNTGTVPMQNMIQSRISLNSVPVTITDIGLVLVNSNVI